jgi:hypothetical protein
LSGSIGFCNNNILAVIRTNHPLYPLDPIKPLGW